MLTINNRDKLDWHAGMTVQDVLDAMGYTYVLMTVTVNGTLIPRDDWAACQVPDDAEIGVFHLAHGG
jgi:thiamine biosynthesis protein ThiS